MKAENLKRIQAMLLLLAEYFQKQLTQNQLRMYAEDLEEYGHEAVGHAIKKFKADKANKFYPLPAHLIEIMQPAVNPDHEAVEVMNRIWTAIAQHGWPNPKPAREYIGELGWAVVERYGGWKNICQEANDSDGGIMKAQLRETVKSVVGRAKQGLLNTPPALPQPDNAPALLKDIIGASMQRLQSSTEQSISQTNTKGVPK